MKHVLYQLKIIFAVFGKISAVLENGCVTTKKLARMLSCLQKYYSFFFNYL